MARSRVLLAALCLCAAASVHALDGVPSVGGTYRYGHVYWNSTGRSVEFTVEAAIKRNIREMSTWEGTAIDGLAKVGDQVLFPGRQPPIFYFGDGFMEQAIMITVSAYSESEDWVMGSFKTVHEYATPNNAGEPWYAQFTGCCRHSFLVNNKDAEWVITAAVDLNQANKSPRATVLPVVSVPFSPINGQRPAVYVPASDDDDGKVEYRVGKPWEVGNSAVFKSADKSFIAVPLRGLGARCTTSIVTAGNDFAGPGCLFNSLRTELGQRAMTVEGWVMSSTDAGGYVLTVGADDGFGKAGYSGPVSPACPGGYGVTAVCRVASLMIKVDKTHVTVGHESLEDSGAVTTHLEAFDICSNVYLQKRPNAFGDDYLCTTQDDDGSTRHVGDSTHKWFHIAVTRFQHTVTGGSSTGSSPAYVSYKVLVNGRPLMVSKYPGGPSGQREGMAACGEDKAVECRGCASGCESGTYCDGAQCVPCGGCSSENLFRFGCKGTSPGACKFKPDRVSSEFETGESNLVKGPVPSSANATDASVRDFGKGAALIFGAYKGAKESEQYFDGALDEWRFWNGARSDSALLNNYKRPMTIKREKYWGDPSDPTRRITDESYLVSSVLMASWNFDQECPETGTTGCVLKDLESMYPKDQDPRVPYPPGKQGLYTAYTYKTTSGDVDFTGRMFYSLSEGMEIDANGKLTLQTNVVGEHQVVVLMSYGGNVAPVPVDFIVNVLPAGCEASEDEVSENYLCSLCRSETMLQLPAYKCAFDETATPGVRNSYMPKMTIKASVLRAHSMGEPAGDAYYLGETIADVSQNDFWKDSIEAHLYPHEIRTYAGVTFQVQLAAMDEQEPVDGFSLEEDEIDNIFTKIGLGLGRMPAGAKFSTVKDSNPAQVNMAWTPCGADLGTHTLCFEATDSHQAAGERPGRPMATRASSEQKCVKVRVEEEAAPSFLLGQASGGSEVFVMGRRKDISITLGSPNCLADIRLATGPGRLCLRVLTSRWCLQHAQGESIT